MDLHNLGWNDFFQTQYQECENERKKKFMYKYKESGKRSDNK
ncbi:MAG TPA: hypothetical protein VKY40_00355 [Halanaerobiales bacterium]|nr:hypothetical protein [Halanaerobiales bacterium]